MRRHAPLLLPHGPLTIFLQPLNGDLDPLPLIQALPHGMPVMWCDSARFHAISGRWSMVGFDPWLTLIAQGDRIELRTSAATRVWRGNPLDALRQVMRRYRMAPAPSHPHARAVGLMGMLSYDLNRWIEPLPEPQPVGGNSPEMLWCAMRTVVLFDHHERRSWLVGVLDPHLPPSVARRETLEALAWTTAHLTSSGSTISADPARGAADGLALEATTPQAEFETMVARALEHIGAGDIFQANVAQRFTASWRGDALALYQTLRRINPSPFACFLSWNDLRVVSCSPERLVRVQEGRVDTRPIAGTRPRGDTPQEDAVNSLELLMSEKERAEHLMLVDLARNDVGRVCAMGSVAVDELMTLEAYSHVIHIVSNVAGTLRPGVDAVDVIRAVFPGGTITGCPKVRCMQILRSLEPVARGLYTGSLGYLGFDGTMDLNIAIRTMVLQGTQLSFHVGAGIVADSVPEREYQETLAKAKALLSALRAITEPARAVDATRH